MRTLKQIGLHIALAAMILHALVPAGWMPDTSGLHRAPLMLCDGSGPMPMDMGASRPGDKQGHGDAHHSDSCPYFAAPHFATAPAPLADLLPAARIETTVAIPPAAHLAQAQHYEPHAPRGPPLLHSIA